MSIARVKSDRRILPRWRKSTAIKQAEDLYSLRPGSGSKFSDTGTHFREAKYHFYHQPSIGAAADLIAAAGPNEDADALEASSYILKNESLAPASLVRLAKTFAAQSRGEVAESCPWSAARHIKQLLRLNPRNPVLWSDMARHYSSFGDRERAIKCMNTALQLAPNHRWLLRVAARFYVHVGDPIRAHKLLATHPRTKSDPWLIAAELATAQVAAKVPKFWSQANDILRWDRFSAKHISELATAVAMFELESGTAKRSRKLVTRGLEDPTENTLAQVSWAQQNKHLTGFDRLDELVHKTDEAYEADFSLKMVSGDFLNAKESGKSWSLDEPFAARPLAGLAYLASILDDYDGTVKYNSQARMIDGKVDPTLQLNSIYATLSAEALDPLIPKDKKMLDMIYQRLLTQAENNNAYHALANLGLYHYRYGDPVIGRELYSQVIAYTEKSGSLESAAMASLFATREAILAGETDAKEMLIKAVGLTTRSRSKIAEFYKNKVEDLIANPEKSQEILSPGSAAKYLNATVPKPKISPVKLVRGQNGEAIAYAPMRKPDSQQ